MTDKPLNVTPAAVAHLLASPACLRGRIHARKLAAMASEPGTDDYRINMQKVAELERQASDAAA